MKLKPDLFKYIDGLENVNEKRVWDMLENYVENTDIEDACLCNICVMDIAAITLNNIKPHYQNNVNIQAAKNLVSDLEIYRQIRRAMQIVINRPHH